ncbi:MAG: outer membrane protein assembly factor [Salinibacter sp.]
MLYLARRTVLLAALGLLAGRAAPAQTETAEAPPAPRPQWTVLLDGEGASWPDSVTTTAPLDSVEAVGRRLLRHYRRAGHYYARVDSATVDTTSGRPHVRIYLRRGPQVTVGRIRITGASAVPPAEVRRLLDTEVGAPLDPRRLEADIQALLDRYEEKGHPLAQIRVKEARVDRAAARLALTLAIDEGPQLWLRRVEVPSDARTSPGLVARLAGLDVGAPLTNYDPKRIRAALRDHPFFQSVGTPELSVGADGGAVLRVPVEETAPGAFDLVLGYLPPSGPGRGGTLVGSGHLLLEHLFGGGRRIDLSLNRRPGQASVVDLSVSDPYLLGLPFRVTGTFRGEQRDSTYGERRYGLSAGYHVSRSFELSGRLSREVVTPGQAGARLRDGRQRIPRAQTLFYGVGVRYESVDRRENPRRGLRIDVRVDQGRKERSLRRVGAAGDTTRSSETLRQERFRGTVRAFLPLFDRQVVVVGGDGAVLRSRSYDRSDLFRFGGATSLRGYDEDQFLGHVTLRGLLEYRVQLGRRSYAYAFGDLGYVERPALRGAPATQSWRPGYGLGLQVDTAIGLIRTTYALNPEVATPADGRLHFGLSVGL